MPQPRAPFSYGIAAGSTPLRSAPRESFHLLACAAFVFVVSLPAVTTRIYASDEVQYFAFLRSCWFDRDLSFDNEYRYFYDRGIAGSHGFHETFLERTTATGLRMNFGTVGSALLWAPFYGVADAAVLAMAKAGYDVARDGFSRPYVVAVCYASALYGFLALLMAAAVAREVATIVPTTSLAPRVGRRAATAAAAVALSTPLVFYMYVAPAMAHACSAFAVALFVLVWLKVRRRWTAGGMVALGGAAALMAMVREQDAFFVVGPALDFAVALARRLRPARPVASGDEPASAAPSPTRIVGNALAGCVAFALCFIPQALAYLTLNGRIGPSPLVNRKMTWTSPHAIQVVFSPEHGLLFWTPVVAFAVSGLVWLAASSRNRNEARLVGLCLLLMVASQVYIAGSVESWTVAGAFGQRRFIGMTALLAAGLASVLAWSGFAARRAAALWIALFLCAWWNVALMVQFGAGMMDRQRLQLGANAWNAFVVVPRELPRLAYRYAVDRSSFYAPRPAPPRSPIPDP